jgi:hypothetical protein
MTQRRMSIRSSSLLPVRHVPMGTFLGKVVQDSPAKGVDHTNEGLSAVPNYGGSAPDFTIGQEFISQDRPLGGVVIRLTLDIP